MSSFWSGWVIFFAALNILFVVFLFIFALRVRIPVDEDGNTGHIWAHGVLREGVRRLPVWWILMSIGLLVFSLVYLVLYPGLGAYEGTLGWSSTKQVEQAMQRNDARLVDLQEFVRKEPISALSEDPGVLRAAGVVYDENCAACHGAQGKGNVALGAPDLTDDNWSWGGSDDAIRTSLLEGRRGAMPALGGALGDEGVRQVTTYVYTLNGRSTSRQDLARKGAERYQQLCASCHGPEGKGKPALGAPDLTDDSWLYGGDRGDIAHAIRHGRQGVMPAWEQRLSAEEVEMLIAWMRAAGGDGNGAP